MWCFIWDTADQETADDQLKVLNRQSQPQNQSQIQNQSPPQNQSQHRTDVTPNEVFE